MSVCVWRIARRPDDQAAKDLGDVVIDRLIYWLGYARQGVMFIVEISRCSPPTNARE